MGSVDSKIKVEVYRNLHKDCWSIRHKGKVIAYSDMLVLSDAQFVVRPAGRARVLKERRKNVHAFVKGMWEKQLVLPSLNKHYIEVRYNPYIDSRFVDLNGSPIYKAQTVVLYKRKCYAII